jgi:hypothetical protein
MIHVRCQTAKRLLRMASHLETLVGSVCTDPHTKLQQIRPAKFAIVATSIGFTFSAPLKPASGSLAVSTLRRSTLQPPAAAAAVE